MRINRGFKFKIVPTREQAIFFESSFGAARLVYNETIDFIACSLSYGLGIPKASYCDDVLRNSFAFLTNMDSIMVQQVRRNAYDAYKAFLKKKSGKPCFKSKHHTPPKYTTIPTNNNIRIEVIDNKSYIRLPKVGLIRMKQHRQLPQSYRICEVTVSRYLNRYYVSIILEYEIADPIPKTKVSKSAICGLDYNQSQMLISNVPLGIDSAPKYYLNTMKRLAKLQRSLSHCVKGSNNYKKVQNKLQKLHRHIANQRNDFLHKLSRQIVNTYDVVVVEDIDLRIMSQLHHMGRSLMDNGYGIFREMLKYKMMEKGKYYIKANKYFPSSKQCYKCGYIHAGLQITDKEWECPACHTVHNRDINAAKNLAQYGESTLGSIGVQIV